MDRKSDKKNTTRAERTKKRRFRGNQFTSESNTDLTSSSAKKISKQNPDFQVNVDPTLSYCIVNFALFLSLQNILICKTCKNNVKFAKRAEKGLGFQLAVTCKCETDTYIPSSPQISSSYEINRRLVFAMRLVGVGYDGIVHFCGLMDIGKVFSKNAYYKIIEHIHIAASTVVQLVFKKAVSEEQDLNEAAGNERDRLTVSGDGSWARRGFSSLIGLASLIGKYTGKVVDLIIKSSVCKACEDWIGKEDTAEYEDWYETHEPNCNANHEGSAGLMEVNGIIEMFKRSVALFKVYYEYYIGDGDTKTFKSLLDVEPYGGTVSVKKLECVLHVKKRMYKRAKDAKKKLTQMKKTKKILEAKAAEEEKSKASTSAKSKQKPSTVSKSTNKTGAPKVKTAALTNKVMQQLSTYYELAVRRHPNSTKDMKNAIWSTFYHKISTDDKPQHKHCPVGADSWCKYRLAESNGTLEDYKHPPALDEEIQPFLKEIYTDLTSDDLLQRCVGANTQNTNESFNACVWNIVPKHMFAGRKVVEIAAYCAACTYNEGFQPLLKIMEVMGVTVGNAAVDLAQQRDSIRISNANKRSIEASKERRAQLRKAKVAENEFFEEEEDIMYGPGIAD